MRTLAVELEETEVVTTPIGDVTCTHTGYGFNWADWPDAPIRSFRIVGTLDGDGKFVAAGPPEYADWNQAEYEALLAVSEFSADGDFLMSEVIAQHPTVLARNIAERVTAKRI